MELGPTKSQDSSSSAALILTIYLFNWIFVNATLNHWSIPFNLKKKKKVTAMNLKI